MAFRRLPNPNKKPKPPPDPNYNPHNNLTKNKKKRVHKPKPRKPGVNWAEGLPDDSFDDETEDLLENVTRSARDQIEELQERMLSPRLGGYVTPLSDPTSTASSATSEPPNNLPPPLRKWSYETPLEDPPEGVFLDPRIIEINGVKFQARSDCNYRFDLYSIMDQIIQARSMDKEQMDANPLFNETNILRNLLQQDLFSLVYFVLKNPLANHPFIVQACREVEEQKGDALYTWARDHLKTTVITVGRNIQKVLINPERRIGIFSATRPLAVKILNVIRQIFESKFLVLLFSDIFYEDPYREAPKWTEAPDGGLTVKRKKGYYKEATISAWGLIEGMPTGDHFTDMTFDDIVNNEVAQSRDMTSKLNYNFDLAENLGSQGVELTVVGTYYAHDDTLVYIRDKLDIETGRPLFPENKKTGTVNGEYNGSSVFLPERVMQRKRSTLPVYIFNCQILLNPTPKGHEKLDKNYVILIDKVDIPQNIYKFMTIDGAGDSGGRERGDADAWAFAVCGFAPSRDFLGYSDFYILDLIIESMDLYHAQETAVEMYCRNGRILRLGIEKIGMSSTEIHIASALRSRGRYVSQDQGNLVLLKPAARTKQFRIESALVGPLRNSKIHISKAIPSVYRERLFTEMDKFPKWKDDGLDALSYQYDIVKDFRFGMLEDEQWEDPQAKKKDRWDRAIEKARQRGMPQSWLIS